MPYKYQTSIGSFTRKSTFFWASVGATVGLANLWQFPYLASIHGGGLFVLLYLLCLLLVALPLMVTEAVLGRYSRHGIVLAMDGFVRDAGSHRAWALAGPLSVITAFLVLSFTAVFGGIALAYVFIGASGKFSAGSTVAATARLAELVASPERHRELMAWHGFFLVLVLAVSARGVVKGLERSLRITVPCTLVLLVALFALSWWYGRLESGVEHILRFRPEQFTWGSLQAALFHAFYTLGLGVGVWTIFGAYTTERTCLKRSILAVVLMDTLIALLAGIMMFSVALGGTSLDGERGFGLLFVSLPVALAQLPMSQLVITAVFVLVLLVVWATSVSLLEPVVSWLQEWLGAPRGWSVVCVGLAIWAMGLPSLFSFNIWADYQLAGATAYRWLELVTGGILIPAVAILVATFTGWCLTRRYSAVILGNAPAAFRLLWHWVMRLVLPAVALWIGLHYTVFSLSNLCDGESAAVWCGHGAPAVEQSGSKTAPQQPDIRYHND